MFAAKAGAAKVIGGSIVRASCACLPPRLVNARNQENKLWTDNICSRKGVSAKAAHMVHWFGESVLRSLIENAFSRLDK